MSTIQKMISEIRDLSDKEWDAIGGMGTSGPTQEATQTYTYVYIHLSDGTTRLAPGDVTNDTAAD